MPSERINSLQTAFCRQTSQAHFFIISDKLPYKNPKIQKNKIAEVIKKNRNPPPSFPRKWESKATGIYRKNRNSKTTETERTGFPPARE
ncbi:TPA: hypothetical protein ACFNMU_000494 [Neisseria lactamica]|nr:hypothetical protein [Neisseria meningitidis]